ncbi:MAG: THUMP domain-containing protein [Chitinophagales bacterium]
MRYTIVAKTLQGLENVLAQELQEFGAENVRILKRAVSCNGELGLLYAANIHVRTALKILVELHSFHAKNESELYKGIRAIAWDDILDNDTTFAIDSTVYSKYFTHTQYPALKMKDAIADGFRESTGKRPSVDREDPDVRFNLHISDDLVTVSLDSSGSSLHKRGYRTGNHPAPISEVLAAGMLYLSGWTPATPLRDPMCGSGTIPIEAALMATHTAPGLLRKHFGFQRWKNYDQSLFRSLMVDAAAAVKEIPVQIVGSDKDARFVEMAKRHAAQAGMEKYIQFSVARFEDTHAEGELLIMNPPYGERMRETEITELSKQIGDVLKQNYPGCSAWVFSGNPQAAKFIGLKPSAKIPMKNGPLDSVFLRFDIRSGKYYPRKE